MIKTIPNFIRNSEEIVALAKIHWDKFKSREGADSHASIIPGLHSKFKTLKNVDMSQELIAAIFKDSDFDPDVKDFFDFIQIQKYNPFEYIAPHADTYSVQKIHLITLTSSDHDGLICVTEDGSLEKIYDRAGQYIDFPYDAVHWVDPVEDLRFTLVVAE